MSEKVKPHQHDHSGMKISIFLSTLCLIHCISFPILIMVFSVFNIAFHPPEWIEYSLLISTAILGYYSMRHGINLHYHDYKPLILFTVGIVGALILHLLIDHHVFSLGVTLLEILFALLIAISQIMNYKLTKSHACTTEH